jgi:hypothetical protein
LNDEEEDGALRQSFYSALDFDLGTPRCDGRLARVLALSGLKVSNPSLLLRAIEVGEPGRQAELYAVPPARRVKRGGESGAGGERKGAQNIEATDDVPLSTSLFS